MHVQSESEKQQWQMPVFLQTPFSASIVLFDYCLHNSLSRCLDIFRSVLDITSYLYWQWYITCALLSSIPKEPKVLYTGCLSDSPLLPWLQDSRKSSCSQWDYIEKRRRGESGQGCCSWITKMQVSLGNSHWVTQHKLKGKEKLRLRLNRYVNSTFIFLYRK